MYFYIKSYGELTYEGVIPYSIHIFICVCKRNVTTLCNFLKEKKLKKKKNFK